MKRKRKEQRLDTRADRRRREREGENIKNCDSHLNKLEDEINRVRAVALVND